MRFIASALEVTEIEDGRASKAVYVSVSDYSLLLDRELWCVLLHTTLRPHGYSAS